MISNYLLFESYFLSNKDLIFDFDKFKNNNESLLIVGLAGSGKTTLAKELSKKYNAKLINGDEIYKKYLSMNPDEVDKMSDEEYLKNLNNLYNHLEKLIRSNKKLIIEGLQIIMMYHDYKKTNADTKFILNKPIIILGLSSLKSSYRVWKREGIIDFQNFKSIKKEYNEFKDDVKVYKQ